MLLLIIAGVVFAVIFNVSVLPVLVGGAILMALCAYLLTQSFTVLQVAMGIPLVLGPRLVLSIPPEAAKDNGLNYLMHHLGSDMMLGGISVIVIIVSWGIGTFGPIGNLPLHPNEVVGMAKTVECERGAATFTHALLKRLMFRK